MYDHRKFDYTWIIKFVEITNRIDYINIYKYLT